MEKPDLNDYHKVERDSDLWIAENAGDWIHGMYIRRQPKANQHQQTKYTLLVEENGKQVEKHLFATKMLDELFEQAHINDMVYIELKELVPQRPPRSDFKKFEMHIKPHEHAGLVDNPAVMNDIMHICELLGIDQDVGEVIKNCEKIAEYVKENQVALEYKAKDVADILKQLRVLRSA